MSATVKTPVFTSAVHRKLQHHGWQGTDVELSTDDIGLDLTDLQTLSGFLMNEAPDGAGHFYPPWVADIDPIVKDEPIALFCSTPKEQQQQQEQQAPLRSSEEVAIPIPEPKVDISMGSSITSTPTARFATGTNPAAAATPTLKKSASGGVTRRRSSSKEEQAKKRRERNRVLARRTRLRKKFFFQSLQQQVAGLQRENERLKGIITTRCSSNSDDILLMCASRVPSVVADCASQATALLDQGGFLLVKALQSSQPSFCVTDPQLPDNPIVYASDNFIELTGYERRQVLGRNCRFLQGPDTDPEAVAKIRKGIEEGTDTSVYLRQYKADGTVFWNHVFVAALRNSEHKIINYVGIQHPLEKEPSPEVVACINSDQKESEAEEEQQTAAWAGWEESVDLIPWANMGGWAMDTEKSLEHPGSG